MSGARAGLWLAGTAGAGVLVWLLAPVLTPFLLGALFAYLGDPAADRLERLGLGRTGAVVIVFLVITVVVLGLLLVLLPLLERQLAALAARVPAYLTWFQEQGWPRLARTLGVAPGSLDLAAVKEALAAHWKEAGGVAAGVLAVAGRSGAALAAWVGNLVITPVVTFYLLRDWNRLVTGLHSLVPRHLEPTVSALAGEADEVLGAFLRGQLLVMAALAAIYTLGLWWVGLELALLLGLLAGLVSFVPYLGLIVGILAAGLAAYLQFHGWLPVAQVAAVFTVGQLLEGTLLTPWLVGERIGLHPVAVIFAVLAGGQLFGFVGVLLALPVASVVMVLVRHSYRRYLASELYGSDGEGGEG